MKIREVTQTRSGDSYLPIWGQWPFRGAGRWCLGYYSEEGEGKMYLISYQYLVGSCQNLLNIGKIIRSDHNFKQITSPPDILNRT